MTTFLGHPTSRRGALRSLGAGAAALLTAPGWTHGRAAGQPVAHAAPVAHHTARRPHIILILTDDMRSDDLSVMPNVQALLAADGVSFANFMVASPACAPARASILRGQYSHNHQVLRGKGELGGFARFHTLGHEQSTVASWLQEAGYRTALIGKYLNFYPYDNGFPPGVSWEYVPPGWDEWAGVINEGYVSFVLNENGEPVRYDDPGLYSTDVFADMAAAFVTRAAATGGPFFLLLAPRAPHKPAVPAERHAARTAGFSAPRLPSFNEADVADKPAWVRETPPLSAADIAAIDAEHAPRQGTLLAVDELVADLVDALRAAGALENTYILFTSDNGYHLGEHRVVAEKGTPYEEASRVPLLVRGPGVPAGQTVQALASQVDLAPTFAAWADAEAPAFVDGRSLAPLLRGDTPPDWRQVALIEHHAERSLRSGDSRAKRARRSREQPGFIALRADRLTYVEWVSGERELYLLADDPHQLANMADAADPAVGAELSDRLAAMSTCAGAACRTLEEAPLSPAVAAL
jgi:arylsulfatase A-like enzyme